MITKETEDKVSKVICKDKELFFVHIPKNYGTSIMHIVFQDIRGAATHMTADQINSIEQYSEYKNFCFVRDPIERFISVYLWRKRKDELIAPLGLAGTLDLLCESGMNQVIGKDFQTEPDKLNRMFLKQSTWVNQNTVFVGRCENFVYDLNSLKNKYDLDFPIRELKTNRQLKSTKKETKSKLLNIFDNSPDLKNKFYEYYDEDYERFQYSRETS